MVRLPRLAYSHPIRSVGVVFGVILLAVFLQDVVRLPVIVLEPALIDLERIETTGIGIRTLFLTLNFIGMAMAGVFYLWLTDRGWDWLDLDRPGKSEVLWILGGIGLLIAFYIVFNVVVTILELPAQDNQIIHILGDDVRMILLMIGIVFFFNAPAEEFLYRNIVQKRLYAGFGGPAAVVLASLLFTLIHVPAFLTVEGGLQGAAVTLVFIFGGAIVFGFLYYQTSNLWVPIAVHAIINAFQLSLYLLFVLAGLEEEVQTAVIWTLFIAVP